MDVRNLITRILVAAALVALVPAIASAQILSNIGNVNLVAGHPQTLTMTVTGGSTVNFTLTDGSPSNGDVPAVIQTTWNMNPGLTGSVALYGYFDTPAQALASGTDYITSSLVEGQMATGTPTTYTAFTQTNPVGPAGGSLALFTEAITGVNKISTRTDNLDLRINLTGQTVPAGNYTGVLRLQARAI